MENHQHDMTDEKQGERAKSQEMQAPGGLPSMKYFGSSGKSVGGIGITFGVE
jgi:hypothetical protein